MAPKSNALTTREHVEEHLDPYTAGQNTSDDNAVDRYINSASQRIRKLAHRPLYWVSDETIRVESTGSRKLRVPDHRPIETVHKVVWAPDPNTSDTVDANDYTLRDAERGRIYRHNGMWSSTEVMEQRIERIGTGHYEKHYEVTITGGWTTPAQENQSVNSPRDLPYDIELAVISYVQLHWYKQQTNRAVDKISMADGSKSFRHTDDGVLVPDGFVQTAKRYRDYSKSVGIA